MNRGTTVIGACLALAAGALVVSQKAMDARHSDAQHPVTELQPVAAQPVVAIAQADAARPARAPDALQRQALQTVQNHCLTCHGPEKQKGGVRLDTLDTDFVNGTHAEDWHDVLNAINLGDMPPKGQAPLPDAQRRALVDWITRELKHAKESKTRTAGQAVLRRLTRYEYNNTIADLLGIQLDYAANLPPDSKSKDGFENNGLAQGMSPIQLEYYLEAARQGLAKAIVEGERPQSYEAVITKSEKPARRAAYKTHKDGLVQPGEAFIGKTLEFPREGVVRVKVLVDAVNVPEGQGYPQMLLQVGHRADTIAPEAPFARADVVPAADGGPIEMTFTGRIDDMPLPGHNPKFPGILIMVANAYEPGPEYKALQSKRDALKKQVRNYEKAKARAKKQGKPEPPAPQIQDIQLPEMPSFVVKSITFEGPILDNWPPSHHRQILFDRPAAMDEDTYAQQVIRRFIDRAYRRPATDADVASVYDFYRSIRADMPSFESAIREALALVLISPDFLYLVEPASEQTARTTLTDHQRAARLSYLLWSTMPDDALREAADRGELDNPDALEKHARRMIRDKRSQAFVQHFTSQWLDLPAVDRVAVNPQYYPDFDQGLKADMKRETVAFVAEILRSDLSALSLIDSDFVMVNRPLAQHYGLPAPEGSTFERVALQGHEHRGGLLTHASVLLMNSNGEDSHPIRRAVWLRQRLLDDPPAPPPPNVPDLDTEDPNFVSLPLKRQLELHRQKASCNDCHLRIDPWGIPLEHFDAVGAWREDVNRVVKKKRITSPVVSDAELPGGQQVSGVDDLKRVLGSDLRQHFVRGLVRHMLAHSLGRSLDYTDRDEVDALVTAFEDSGYQIDELLVEIVKSNAFNTK